MQHRLVVTLWTMRFLQGIIALTLLTALVSCNTEEKHQQKAKEALNKLLKQGPLGHLIGDGSQTCLICEFIVGELMYQLESNTVKTEVLPAIEEKICQLLFPSNGLKKRFVTSGCEDVADLLLKALLKVLDDDIKPTQVCQKLTICKKDELVFAKKRH